MIFFSFCHCFVLESLCDLDNRLHECRKIFRRLGGNQAAIDNAALIKKNSRASVLTVVLHSEEARELAALQDLGGDQGPKRVADATDDGAVAVLPNVGDPLVDLGETAKAIRAETAGNDENLDVFWVDVLDGLL